jgi:hypothetical protein
MSVSCSAMLSEETSQEVSAFSFQAAELVHGCHGSFSVSSVIAEESHPTS